MATSPIVADASPPATTLSAPTRDATVDDLDIELARLLNEERDDTELTRTDSDLGPRSFCTVESPDATRVAALEARVAMLEGRLNATLDAFEAEVQARMTKAATEAALATRAHLEALAAADADAHGKG